MKIEDFITKNIKSLLHGIYSPSPQTGSGSYHGVRDFPELLGSCDMKINEARRYYASG